LFFMFAGGALAGAAAAYLAQARNREQVRDLALHARDQAGRLPQALLDASSAAKEAFTEALGGNGEAVAVVKAKHK
jgi:GAF domain-containing protein